MVDAIKYRHNISEACQWRKSPSSRALVGNSEYQSFFLNPLAEGSPADDQQPIAYAGASVAANDGNVSHNPLADEFDNISSPPDSPARPAALASAFERPWPLVVPRSVKPCVQGPSLQNTSSMPSLPSSPLSNFMSTPEPLSALHLRHPLGDGVQTLNALSAEIYDSDVAMPFSPTEPVAPCTPRLAAREAGIVATPEPLLLPSPTELSWDGEAPAEAPAREKPLTLKVRCCQSLAAAYRHAASHQPDKDSVEECASPPLPPPPPPSPTSLLVAIQRLATTFATSRQLAAPALHTGAFVPARRASPPAPSTVATCVPSTRTAIDDDHADFTVQGSACAITDLASARSALRKLGVFRAASGSAGRFRPMALPLSPTVSRAHTSFTPFTEQESKPEVRLVCAGLLSADRFLWRDGSSDPSERDWGVGDGVGVHGDGGQVCAASGLISTGMAAASRAPPRAQLGGDGGASDSDADIGNDGCGSSVTSGGISKRSAAFREGPEASLWSPEDWLEPQTWEPLRKKYGCVRQTA